MELGAEAGIGRVFLDDLGSAFGFRGATACPINGLSVAVKCHLKKAEDLSRG